MGMLVLVFPFFFPAAQTRTPLHARVHAHTRAQRRMRSYKHARTHACKRRACDDYPERDAVPLLGL